MSGGHAKEANATSLSEWQANAARQRGAWEGDSVPSTWDGNIQYHPILAVQRYLCPASGPEPHNEVFTAQCGFQKAGFRGINTD